MASKRLVIGILMTVGAIIIVAVPAILILGLQLPMQSGSAGENLRPTINVTIYGSEIPGNKFGWGLSRDNITSPGPTLKFKVGDVVGLTVHNIGKIPHSFGIVPNLSDDTVLFNSQVATSNNPIPAGRSEQSLFKITDTGEFKYICTVPGHKELGMYGNVTVSK